MTAPLQLHTIVSMPFAENTYVAWLPGRMECLVIDPGTEPEAINRIYSGNFERIFGARPRSA